MERQPKKHIALGKSQSLSVSIYVSVKKNPKYWFEDLNIRVKKQNKSA
jgi:hypothetical protein